MPKLQTLSHKQRRFVDAYLGEAKGNATKAAELAGYSKKTVGAIGSENLQKPQIKAALQVIGENDPLIATRDERQRLLTEFARSPSLTSFERMRAVELLGKSQGDFSEKHDHSGDVRIRLSWAP